MYFVFAITDKVSLQLKFIFIKIELNKKDKKLKTKLHSSGKMFNLEAQKGVFVFATAEKVSLQLKFIFSFTPENFFNFLRMPNIFI